MIIGTAIKPTNLIVKILVNDKRSKLQTLSRTIKNNASRTDRLLFARGLSFVLSTFLSNFLSVRSFMAQPKDLVRKEPKITIVKLEILKLSDKNKPHNPGQSNNQKPIGL
jgi:hypothetical protein